MNMFSGTSPSNRKAPANRKDEERKKEDEKRNSEKRNSEKRRAVSSGELRMTFENVMHSVTMCPDSVVNRDSVVRCLRSIYNWMVFDADSQLDLPVAPGSVSMKMWPHGAVVDTRRASASKMSEKSSRRLRELDEDAIFCIANSVVSSTFEDERPRGSKGEVTIGSPKGSHFHRQQGYIQPSSISSYQTTVPMRIIPEACQLPPEVYQPVPTVPRVIARYSVLSSAVPPIRAQETPEISHIEMYQNRGKKPKVGTAKRRDNDDGVPIAFADE